jgi:hypothetical protein
LSNVPLALSRVSIKDEEEQNPSRIELVKQLVF